ncbi:MAG: hypothetical protein JNM77_03375 [Pseudonocardia sp.]|nr:hypothetical protein [Pseudonocardia sp.]
MDGTALGQIIEALRSTPARPGPGGDAAALAELADLVALTGLVEQLSEQARLHLAPRPTVASHLVQAQEHLAGLRRELTHATEMLAYNTAQRSPLSAVS